MTESLLQLQNAIEQNILTAWLVAIAISAVIALLVRFVVKFASARIKKITQRTKFNFGDVLVEGLSGIKAIVVFFWCLHGLSKTLTQNKFIHETLFVVVVALTMFQIGDWGFRIIRILKDRYLDKELKGNPSAVTATNLFYIMAQGLFITFIVLVGLSNLGVNIGALLAGLGVGGIAVALAAQNLLGDLLASLSIVLDKPFVVGDYIVSGKEGGTIEHIGIKTTRVRSLSGEELVFSNKDLLESRIQNFKSISRRRVVQQFGITYSINSDLLAEIPKWVEEFIRSYDKLEFDRCHFIDYGASALNFEFVFYVSDPNYNVRMDYTQKVLIDIFKKFEKEGVEFAFPTQSLYIEKLPK